jgi:uncharacterized protein YbbC (DUF1343 family)
VPRVLSGLDVLSTRLRALLGGQRVGLLCHQASVTTTLAHASQVIRQMPRVRLVRLFAPEHGLGGSAQDHAPIRPGRDVSTGLPVASLYGARLGPDARSLRGIDALVVDLQDVGARYYTFVWTMALAMAACARADVRVVVLDRPNPLGGERLEGNMPEPAWQSFVGVHPLPVRHGMTIGELAGYLNEAHALGADLTVVPMTGWRRSMDWADTGLPWVAPSPNMPTPDTAAVYPGGCLIEGTNLSEGRGTTRPFELCGAPFLDGPALALRLERRGLAGARFRAVTFEPTFHKWAGRRCGGVQVHVTDARRFRPFLTYLALIVEARRQAPRHFRWRRPPYEFERRRLPIDLLGGGPAIRQAIERGRPLRRLEASWRDGLAAFARARRPYLLYP